MLMKKKNARLVNIQRRIVTSCYKNISEIYNYPYYALPTALFGLLYNSKLDLLKFEKFQRLRPETFMDLPIALLNYTSFYKPPVNN